MQIKPFDNAGYSEYEKKAFQEKNIKRAHRDFYIYDEVFMPLSSFDIENRLLAGVTQVVKLLVRGLPDEPGVQYDKEKSERMTFVKTMYIYDAFMNNSITDMNERFRKAVLRPIFGLVSAYTDTKRYVDTGTTYPILQAVDNQYGITIYSFTNRSIMSILCDPVMIRDGLVTGVSRFDVTDPRFNIVKYLNKESSAESIYLPNHFVGSDLIRNGETNTHFYSSYYKENNTFTEENLLETSRKIFSGNKIRFNKEEQGLMLFREKMINKTAELMDKKRALRTLIIDITKASAYSLFESFTMHYETGKKSGFKMIKSPFKQYHIQFMEQKMLFVYTEFILLCEKVTELFGRTRILLHVNDVEHIVRCIFLDESPHESRVVTLRMTKLECINDYIYESLHGSHHRSITDFKMEHDLDLLNYYSYQHNGQQFSFRGRL
jgi:hypothetical protein